MVSKKSTTQRKPDTPCRVRWEHDNACQHFSVTIPPSHFEGSATSLSQMEKETVRGQFFVALVEFYLNSMHYNVRSMGESAAVEKDFYVRHTDDALIRRVSLDGSEGGSNVQPKYSLAMEFLARSPMGLEAHSLEDVTDLRNIFADSNFAGIRLWFLIFDNTVDPHEAFKRTIEKNKSFAIMQYLISEMGMSRADAERAAFGGGSDSRQSSRRRTRDADDDGADEDRQRGDGEGQRGHGSGNRYDGVADSVDARTAAEKYTVSDPMSYYKSITSFCKFGEFVDFLTRSNTCERATNQLFDSKYPITSPDPDFNILHFKHWGEITTQNWLLTTRVEGQTECPFIVCEKQTILAEYLVNRDGRVYFEFPYPQLVFRYGPEQCSVRELFPRTFPWKTSSRFETRYDILADERYLALEIQRRERAAERARISRLDSSSNPDNKSVSDYGHTIQDLETLVKIQKQQIEIAGGSHNVQWQTPFAHGIDERLSNTTSLRLQYEKDASEELAKGPGSAMINLKARNVSFYNKLKDIRALSPEAYPEMLEIYKEELLSEFVKVCRASEADNTDAVIQMMLWFQTEEKLKVHCNAPTLSSIDRNSDASGQSTQTPPPPPTINKKTFYRTLCHEVPTMDPSIGRYNSAFAHKALCLETLLNVANIHFVYLKMRENLFWAYFDPDVAQHEIGTKMKAPFVQLGAPATSKSHMFVVLDQLTIPKTVTKIDDFTDKSFMTGDGNFQDAILIVDEAGAVFTQDPHKMNSERLESYKRTKSMVTEQLNTYQVCNLNTKTGKRATERISSKMSMSIATNANILQKGSDQSLNNRCNIEITRPIERPDKNIVALVGCASSEVMQRNREIFVLRQRIEQFLFCMICKMIQTRTVPIGVNIQVGKILYDNMVNIMSDKYPKLRREVRDVQRLSIQFYCAAIIDAIDVCWFSEVSPWKIRQIDGRVICAPFNFSQIQAAMPAMCLCEDTAIRLITGWVRQVIHNELLYASLLSTATAWAGFKFPYVPVTVIPDEQALGVISEYDTRSALFGVTSSAEMLPAEREHLEEIKANILLSEFPRCEIRQEGAVYASSPEESAKLHSTISYRKYSVPVEGGFVKYTDTNWIEVPPRSRAEFISRATVLLRETRQTTQDVLDFELSRAASYSVSTSDIYPMYDDKGKRLTLKQMETYYPGVSTKRKRTFEPFIANEIMGTGANHSRCYISVHYLRQCSLESIFRSALRTFCYEGCTERKVLIDRFAGDCPFLLQTYKIHPIKTFKLKVINPNYVDAGITDAVFAEVDGVDYEFKSCPSTRDMCITIEGSLEEYVFKQHFKACGKPPEFDYFLPRVVNENIRAIIKASPELRGRRAPMYPLSFTHTMAKSAQQMSSAIKNSKQLLEEQAQENGASGYVGEDPEDSDCDDDGGELSDDGESGYRSLKAYQSSKVTSAMSASIKKLLVQTLAPKSTTGDVVMRDDSDDDGGDGEEEDEEEDLHPTRTSKKGTESLLVKRPLSSDLKKTASKGQSPQKKRATDDLPLTKANPLKKAVPNARTKLMVGRRTTSSSGMSHHMLE